MKTRIITAAVGLCILLPVLIFSNTFLYVLFAALLAIIATYELLNCMKLSKKISLVISSLVYSVLSVLLTRAFASWDIFMKFFGCFTFVYILTLFIFALFGSSRENLPETMFSAICIIYVTFGFISFMGVRDFTHGAILFPLGYIAAWVSDTGAYFVGIKFGKTKLIPEISPKKTLEGFFGGLASCFVVFLIYAICVHIFANDIKPNYFWIMISAILLSVASVVGDLIASMIKRRYKIKDYSHIFPGHGGVLDRFDSIIATTACLFVLSSIMPLFK